MLFIAVFLSAATLLPLNGNEGKKKSFPACSFSTKLEMNFPADTAFLLLYLEESSYNMQETKARIDAKEKQFLEALKKEYPSVKYTSSTESIGGKNNDPYRDDTAFQPCIRKTFLLSFSRMKPSPSNCQTLPSKIISGFSAVFPLTSAIIPQVPSYMG